MSNAARPGRWHHGISPGRAAFAAMLLTLAACAHHSSIQPAPVGGVRAILVDSVPWKSEEAESYLRRVEVHVGSATDTIPGVLTDDAPVVVGTHVLGFAYRDEAIDHAFEYDAERRVLTWDALPPDFNAIFSSPSIAPDGRHIAYIIIPGDATGQAVVATWPSGTPLWKSAVVTIPSTDMPGGSVTRWLSPDTAEVFLQSGETTGEQWLHLLFSVRRGLVRADTVRQIR